MSEFYELLEQIQQKPGLYLGKPSISNLQMFLTGYQFARRQLNMALSAEEQEFQAFQPWLQQKFSLQTSQSWSQLILFHASDERAAFKNFFDLLQEFRQSQSGYQALAAEEPELEMV